MKNKIIIATAVATGAALIIARIMKKRCAEDRAVENSSSTSRGHHLTNVFSKAKELHEQE